MHGSPPPWPGLSHLDVAAEMQLTREHKEQGGMRQFYKMWSCNKLNQITVRGIRKYLVNIILALIDAGGAAPFGDISLNYDQ